MPKITLNGHELEVAEGTTVIQAFKQLEAESGDAAKPTPKHIGDDAEIAHYCWHPGLSIAGVCRLCMVEVEGNPRLQIACNTTVQDGMVVNNQSEKVKETVKWGLDFHLINHPLDCPICDQAGECGLQDQYMKFGQYDSEMAERKVKKRKVVDLGEKIVLDTERCILCSRCVRFTDEVSKTNELGIFNRGDRSEVGTFEDKPLNNDYAVNTVDICPVGALTSKDFRFQQRVWYLKDKENICPGCSTGCNVKTYFNEEGLFRVKPVHNEDVNGYWMCDKGRDTYKYVNRQARLTRAKAGTTGNWSLKDAGAAALDAGKALKEYSADQIALVLTGQYTSEEYEDMLNYFVNTLGSKNVYHWQNNPDQVNEFDGLLLRGDRNPNTAGLKKALSKHGIQTEWSQLSGKASQYKAIVVAGPEDLSVYPDLEATVKTVSQSENVFWLTSNKSEVFDGITTNAVFIPQKSYAEKAGTFVNHEGREQKFEKIVTLIPGALSLSETATLLSGEMIDLKSRPERDLNTLKQNHFVNERGRL